MRKTSGVLVVLVVAALAAGAYWLMQGGRETAASEQPAAQAPEAGIVRFPQGAPQLSSLSIAAMPTAPVPLAEPLNGRVVFDESHTSRISAPVAGRILELR